MEPSSSSVTPTSSIEPSSATVESSSSVEPTSSVQLTSMQESSSSSLLQTPTSSMEPTSSEESSSSSDMPTSSIEPTSSEQPSSSSDTPTSSVSVEPTTSIEISSSSGTPTSSMQFTSSEESSSSSEAPTSSAASTSSETSISSSEGVSSTEFSQTLSSSTLSETPTSSESATVTSSENYSSSAQSSSASPTPTASPLLRIWPYQSKQIGDPLDATELSQRASCENARTSATTPNDFLTNSCGGCLQDIGILTAEVLNFCVMGLFNQDSGPFTGWMSTTNVCQGWDLTGGGIAHITCSGPNVTGLSITSDLVNGMPSYMGKLLSLETLEVSRLGNVDSSAPFAAEFWQLPHLQDVTISEGIWDITFPANVTSLKRLVIRNMDIVTSSLQNLATAPLERITFIVVDLSGLGTIPSWIGGSQTWSQTLQSLQFEYTGLGGAIPTNLQNLASLTVISLAHNSLTGSIPAPVCSLSLSVCDMRSNPSLVRGTCAKCLD
ncbi:uncharacterized protein SPPG_01990 [Spizellomyces punctatus DAOM BR117]|uniref:Uncharacterized protein n=1 Tax=Spizellomyces punctatus (strain DAOM BR117) TaxID=645134 RepID=A0A0L0HPL6_SPIPD|nr:uncharacterized protein SPPG_01990 [Spizellomyces punctatus DAOM BR117]KND02910.1 hypothetical protein SPPG_01990 [Spizellomyces punctatus DAOM BR117]|eukprot:XP_016610949.1 hypothetical protein SPPG_01990 [Spizellomyces punctatus DAOM BR117]